MTPANLVTTLAEELREATANFKFGAEYQQAKKVAVYEQVLPTDDWQKDTYYPCIVVSYLGGEDTDDGSVADIQLTFGVYAGEARPGEGKEILGSAFKDFGDGWRDLLNLVECVRQYLLVRPILGEQFVLQMPVGTEINITQPRPFFVAYMGLAYEVARPAPDLDLGSAYEI